MRRHERLPPKGLPPRQDASRERLIPGQRRSHGSAGLHLRNRPRRACGSFPRLPLLPAIRADQGYEGGEFSLGRCYEFGIGLPQDRDAAILWFKRSGAQGNSQGAYFAHWLAAPQNFIGFRNDDESRYVMDRIRYSGNFLGGDPAGVTFHSSRERNAFIIAFKTDSNFQQAQTQWSVQHNSYQSRQSQGGGSSCHNPGPPPRPPQ